MDIEVCIESEAEEAVRQAAAAAYSGRAARIELCRAMDQDGLTPSSEHTAAARAAFRERPGVVTMIRPRGGGFTYAPEEVRVMAGQIEQAAAAGADGVALGVLQKDGHIDRTALRHLTDTAHRHRLAVTFHRAFDAAPDALAALDGLVACRVDRVLTSGVPWGQPGTALDGRERLRQVIQHARGRIEVIIGGGVNADNIAAILRGLPREGVSAHAYSGCREAGRTAEAAVRRLVEAARSLG